MANGAANIKSLRLHAEDIDDLQVISALTQDAALFVAELAFLPSQKRFVAALARFAWEHADQAETENRGFFKRLFRRNALEPYERSRALLHFDNVSSVQMKGFSPEDKTRVLDLLAITATLQGDDASGPYVVMVECADGAAIRLEVEAIDVYLTDKGEPWSTPVRPTHQLD